jgi:hypothetical protein
MGRAQDLGASGLTSLLSFPTHFSAHTLLFPPSGLCSCSSHSLDLPFLAFAFLNNLPWQHLLLTSVLVVTDLTTVSVRGALLRGCALIPPLWIPSRYLASPGPGPACISGHLWSLQCLGETKITWQQKYCSVCAEGRGDIYYRVTRKA